MILHPPEHTYIILATYHLHTNTPDGSPNDMDAKNWTTRGDASFLEGNYW